MAIELSRDRVEREYYDNCMVCQAPKDYEVVNLRPGRTAQGGQDDQFTVMQCSKGHEGG